MASWRPASSLFAGGTAQMRTLFGCRVRTRVALERFPVHDPAQVQQQLFDVPKGMIGFIAHPHPTTFNFLVAFPLDQARLPPTLAALVRPGTFKVVEVNEPTFKQQFELEVP